MNDEIKEILEFLEDKRGYYKTLTQDKTDKLIDYITNLQEERNMFKDSFETMSKNYFEEKSRNEKAIKYIEQEAVFYDSYDGEDTMLEELCERYYKELLNILNGGDDNE